MIQLLILLVLLYPISSFITTQTTCPHVWCKEFWSVCVIQAFKTLYIWYKKKDSFQEEILFEPLWVCVCCFFLSSDFWKKKKNPHYYTGILSQCKPRNSRNTSLIFKNMFNKAGKHLISIFVTKLILLKVFTLK